MNYREKLDKKQYTQMNPWVFFGFFEGQPFYAHRNHRRIWKTAAYGRPGYECEVMRGLMRHFPYRLGD